MKKIQENYMDCDDRMNVSCEASLYAASLLFSIGNAIRDTNNFNCYSMEKLRLILFHRTVEQMGLRSQCVEAASRQTLHRTLKPQ